MVVGESLAGVDQLQVFDGYFGLIADHLLEGDDGEGGVGVERNL